LGRRASRALVACLALAAASVCAQVAERAIDIPTRPGVTQRVLLIDQPDAKASVLIFPGGDGGLRLTADGALQWGSGNFLVRTRQSFAAQGLKVILVDAPSDRQTPPYLGGFRQTREHAADIRALIAWARFQYKLPVWLVGTSRGTQSVAYVATELVGGDAPDGIVLTSTILNDPKGRPVPAMPLSRIPTPILVVHHEHDACARSSYALAPKMMEQFTASPRKELIAVTGGSSIGDPCEAYAHHGYNGIEADTVSRIASWITRK